jgi:hypothetical protein
MQVNKFGYKSVNTACDDTEIPDTIGSEETPPVVTADKKLLSTEEVNRIVQDRLAKAEAKIKEAEAKKYNDLVQKYEEVRKTTATTDEERTNLTEEIKKLKNANMSVEEQRKQEIAELQKSLETTQKDLTAKADMTRREYEDYRIRTELHHAAEINDARIPTQLVRLLLGDTKVVPVITEDGKPTGASEVKVAVTEVIEGKSVVTELSPAEAVKKLRSMTNEWGNQFNSTSNKGLDLMSGAENYDTKDGKVDLSDLDKYKKTRHNLGLVKK